MALAARDLRWPTHALDEARRTFNAMGDHDNGLHAALLQIRRQLLLGRVVKAGEALGALNLGASSAMLTARGELVAFEIALRQIQAAPAKAALARARLAADRAGIGPLGAEVERAERTLALPAARLVTGAMEGGENGFVQSRPRIACRVWHRRGSRSQQDPAQIGRIGK